MAHVGSIRATIESDELDTIRLLPEADYLATTGVEFVAPASANPSGEFPATCAVRYLPTSSEVETYSAEFCPVIAAHPVGTTVKPALIG